MRVTSRVDLEGIKSEDEDSHNILYAYIKFLRNKNYIKTVRDKHRKSYKTHTKTQTQHIFSQYTYILCVWVFRLHVHVYQLDTHEGQKRVSFSLELKL